MPSTIMAEPRPVPQPQEQHLATLVAPEGLHHGIIHDLALVQLNGDNFLFYNKSLGDLNVEKFTHKHPRSVDGVNDVWHAYPHSSRNLHDIGIARKLDWRLYK